MATLSIGHLAKATGVKVNTIRFYETTGVLPVPERSASGRRLYDKEGLERLRFVRRGRELGFSLDEIRSLLGLASKPDNDCTEVSRIASTHLDTVETKIASLVLLRDELARISSLCGGGKMSSCYILEALAEPERG